MSTRYIVAFFGRTRWFTVPGPKPQVDLQLTVNKKVAIVWKFSVNRNV